MSVINIFNRKHDKEAEAETNAEEPKENNTNEFDEIAKKNQEKAERLRQERLKANKLVLRSYRIKS